MQKSVSVEIKNKAAYISLSCPVSGNLMCSEMLDEIYTELINAESNREVNLIILKSAHEGVFSKGHNIEQLQGLDHIEAKHYNIRGQKIVQLMRSMKKAILAVVDGDCFGPAFEFILASDLVFATEKSRFAFPEVEYGFIPGFGGTQLACRKIYETFVKE
jgi:enoyl-CoA hydratase